MVIQLPDDGEAKELIMKINMFLAILVAILFNGCYVLNGQCMNGGYGPQCTADGATYTTDGSVSGSDASSSPETGVGNDASGDTVAKCKYDGIVDGVWLDNDHWLSNKELTVKSDRNAIDGKCYVVFVNLTYAAEDGVKMIDTDHMHVCLDDGSDSCGNLTRKVQ